MKSTTRMIAAAACASLLLPAPAAADTLIDNVEGISINREGEVERFAGLVFDEDGVITHLLDFGDDPPEEVEYREDGNGRVTRALMDMALAQDEKLQVRLYSFSSQIMEERNAYYDILEKCSHDGRNITEWLEWFLGCLIRAMEKSEAIIAKVLAKAGFWQTHSQTTMNERQRKVVNRLLDAGEGQFQGGLTTRKYVSLTKASRATAFREISDLVDKKVLIQKTESKGRSVSYDLKWS